MVVNMKKKNVQNKSQNDYFLLKKINLFIKLALIFSCYIVLILAIAGYISFSKEGFCHCQFECSCLCFLNVLLPFVRGKCRRP